MLSINFIQRLFQARRFEQLLDAIAANGLEMPLPLRARLAQSDVAPVALGLKRVADLTYGPTSLSREMTRCLLEAQQADGSFSGDPLATAAAAAAMGAVAEHDEQAAQARYGALAALANMQGDDGLFRWADDRREEDRALVSSFVLYLLAADEPFRHAVRMADLLNYFEEHHDGLTRSTERFWRMARAEVPELVGESALAA